METCCHCLNNLKSLHRALSPDSYGLTSHQFVLISTGNLVDLILLLGIANKRNSRIYLPYGQLGRGVLVLWVVQDTPVMKLSKNRYLENSCIVYGTNSASLHSMTQYYLVGTE